MSSLVEAEQESTSLPSCEDSNSDRRMAPASEPAEFLLNPAKVSRRVLALIAIIVVTGTIANIVIYHVAPSPEHPLAKAMNRFDLGHEPSIPNWYSSLAIVVCAGLLAVIANVKRRRQESFVVHWFGLMALLLLMAVDEAVMIHEMADNTLHVWLNTSGILYFAWVIPGACAVLAVGLAYRSFLFHLDARTQWLFILSGTVFVSGAIGMELVAGVIFTIDTGVESLAHSFSQAAEESLEMLGILLFMYALLDFIGRDIGRIVIRIETAPDHAKTRPTINPDYS